uniref:Nicotinate-nucleotide pyrophosphorylase [carboxylating] n=1 Tax=Arcella intermedia TaxID=1963864 RepID=A0A6B2LCS2_9EUKA
MPPNWQHKIDEYLHEDVPSFDYGGFVVGDKVEKAEILCKARGVLCGVPFARRVFEYLGCRVEWLVEEGLWVDVSKGNVVVARVEGPVRFLLLGERIALNILARASGIATVSRMAREIADKAQWKGRVAGTRKTTPGFRLVEKYSLLVGGVDSHRNDLSSMVMLKDNHIASAGSITGAVTKARSVAGFSIKIEVECQNQQEAEEALAAGAEIVMLDNFKPEALKATSQKLKEKFPHSILEASGGVTLDTLESYFSPHVDVISSSILHQGVKHIDFSLNVLSSSYVKQ